MASCVLFTPQKEEGQLLVRALHERAAYATEQELNCQIFLRFQEAAEQLYGHPAEALVWDVSQQTALAALPEVRGSCREAFLLVLAAADTSPLAFLRPDIAPSSLILRPLGPSEVNRVCREILQSICGAPDEEDCFVIQRKGEQQRIAWGQIYYFESRGRKLYARMRGEEAGFSGTLESLAESLPGQFQRCHRSFIVNMEKIDKVRFADNLICLWDGLEVPLSRGYKRSIKEYGSGRT